MGVSESDFEGITRKHATSKLSEFDDLQSVETFGFRGEALSSLCHLANVVVHTCSENAAVGTRLEFNAAGDIVARRPLARSRGTTVIISNLFYSLPVRRRHLTDATQLAKEFAKAVNLLTAYCLATVHVQINCHRMGKSGEKINVVSNGSSSSLRDNIAAVFGQAQVSALTELIPVDSIPTEILDEFNAKPSVDVESITLEGYISKPPGNQLTESLASPLSSRTVKHRQPSTGRSSGDRQFVFVNGRPCDLARVTRLATDLWRRCSRESYSTSSSGIRMPVQSACSHFPVLVLLFHMPTSTVDVNLTPDKRTLLLQHERYVLALTKAVICKTLSQYANTDAASMLRSKTNLDQSMIVPSSEISATAEADQVPSMSLKRPSLMSSAGVTPKRPTLSSNSNIDLEGDTDNGSTTPIRSFESVRRSLSHSRETEQTLPSGEYTLVDLTGGCDEVTKVDDEDSASADAQGPYRESVPIDFSMNRLRSRWSTISNQISFTAGADPDSQSATEDFSLGQFRADEIDAAESELTTYFSKTNFNELKVVGQFNLGFIIAQHDRDLFIIDQHASDEKYRFEQLCENYRFVSQPLVVPQPLELSVAQEQLLLNNLDVFAKSGFTFHVNEDAPCGQQVQLTATPMLENKVFGRSDIEEMLFVLSESCSRKCRPSRLRDILASRSCRSAVMVGTALDQSKMYRILRNMGTMDHPWNCPHGRPTMRHLFHLGRLGPE
ncbi:unnamed protein product [Calicophoron daubneyi]|uniref:Mismatch repair endonuclease PMS2 n=1 Tax=Calicophoron daubneyi TaxID=300641 RepID=A0AAV2T289_CALDB